MSGGVLGRFLRRLRQAGARVIVDPKAEAEWRRTLAERERRRERDDYAELLRELERVSRWW